MHIALDPAAVYLAALGALQVLLALYILMADHRRDWNLAMASLFVLNGVVAFAGVGEFFGATQDVRDGFLRTAHVADAITPFLLLYLALTYPRLMLGPRSRAPLAAVIISYAAVMSAAHVTGFAGAATIVPGSIHVHARWYELLWHSTPIFLCFTAATAAFTWTFHRYRNRPTAQMPVAVLLGVLLMRFPSISTPWGPLPPDWTDPTLVAGLAYRITVAIAVCAVAWSATNTRRGARAPSAVALGLFGIGFLLSAADTALQTTKVFHAPFFNRTELYLLRPLLITYAIAAYAVLDRPGPERDVRAVIGAGAGAVLLAVVAGTMAAVAASTGWPPNDPRLLGSGIGLATLLGVLLVLRGDRVLALIGLRTGRFADRVEAYRALLWQAVRDNAPVGPDEPVFAEARRKFDLSVPEHELLLAEVADRVSPPSQVARRARDEAAMLLEDVKVLQLVYRAGPTEVWQGLLRSSGQPVALKRVLLPDDYSAENEVDARARLEREVAGMRYLDHPNIVRVLGGHCLGPTFWLVSEYVEGEDLEKRLRRERLDATEALRITSSVLEALVQAHGAGVVHRDVKPRNILLGADGSVKLADFGIASWPARDGLPTLSAAGGSLGTPGYRAPEQALGEREDARTDLWAVGVVLHRMLTGRFPVKSAARESDLDRAAGIAEAGYKTGEASAEASLPPALRRFIGRALAVEPSRRFGSAREMRDALHALPALTGAPESGAGRMQN